MPKGHGGRDGQRGAGAGGKTGKVRMVVFLEPEVRRALKIAAAERDRSASDLVGEAVRRLLGLD